MKTKPRVVALLEIAVVLCSVFLVATLPPIAADQTTQEVSATASEDEYVLDIYGNANEDDTIDMRDLTYVKLIFFGKKPETELADAKYDGKINPLDFIQIKLIIVGKEKELTVVDSADRIVTVKKPIKRIVYTRTYGVETARSLKVPKDIIVGVTNTIQTEKYGGHYQIFFPEFQDITTIGGERNPDIESIITLHPDVVFIRPESSSDPIADACEAARISVIRFCHSVFYKRGLGYYQAEIRKLGYILDKRSEADEFIEFYEGVLNPIKEKVEDIPEEDKPKVYFESSSPYKVSRYSYIEEAGGRNIFPVAVGSVDAEAVIARDPDIIVKLTPSDIHTGYELDASNTKPLKEVRDDIMSRPELEKVTAVENGRVYIISNCLAVSGAKCGCRSFLQSLYMAKRFHPELFKDLDPKAIHQEYLTRFQGLDIDLDKTGVFVHPEPS